MDSEMHALAILEAAESWDWPPTLRIQATGRQGGAFKSKTPKLLSGFIKESQALGGTLLARFWDMVGTCHPQLKENVTQLQQTAFSSMHDSERLLFQGVDREEVNFDPIFLMAAELFTHLGVAIMNPGGRKSGSGSADSIGDIASLETDQLITLAREEGFGVREQAALKALVFRRDGQSCPFTGLSLDHGRNNVPAILAHIIPNSVYGKADTLKCIVMFGGGSVRNLVTQQLNSLSNVMNIEMNAHYHYGELKWGIEGQIENGMVKYIYRRIPYETGAGPGIIHLRDGDEITFGGGPVAAKLGQGPDPLLCNLKLAVARVLKMSGAAELITQLKEDADDSEFPHVYVASHDFCDILTAKLLLSGKVQSML